MRKIEVTATFLKNLNNTEHDYLHRIINESVKVHAKDVSLIAPIKTKYEQAYAAEDNLFKLSQEAPETKDLEMLDKARDINMSDFRMIVDLGTRSKNAGVQGAATVLTPVVKRYKDAGSVPYATNTDMIINLLQDLEEEANASAVVTLQASDIIALLRQNNTAFHTLYNKRSVYYQEIKDNGALLETRKQVDDIFLELVDQVNSIYKVNIISGNNSSVTQSLELLIIEISAYIKQAEKVYNLRLNRIRNKKKREGLNPSKPDAKAYLFRVLDQSMDSGYEVFLTDKDPEGLTERFKDTSLNGYIIYYKGKKKEDLKESGLTFDSYLYEDNESLSGIILTTEKTILAMSEEAVNTAVLSKDGEIIMEFTGFYPPVFEEEEEPQPTARR